MPKPVAPPNIELEPAPMPEQESRLGVTDDLAQNYVAWYTQFTDGKFGYWHGPRSDTRQERVLHNTASVAASVDSPEEIRGLVKIAPGGGKTFLLARHAQGFGMGQRDQNGNLLRTCIVVGTSDGADTMAEEPDAGLQLFAGPDSPHPIRVQRFPSGSRDFDDEAGAYVMTSHYLSRMSPVELEELRSRVAMVQVDESHRAIGTKVGDNVNALSEGKVLIAYDATPTYSADHNAQDRLNLTHTIDDQTFVEAIHEGQSPGIQAIAVHTGQVLTVNSRRESITDADLSPLRNNMGRNSLAVDWVELLTSRGLTGIVRGIRGGNVPAEHALMIRDMIRARNQDRPIINPKTGKPIVVEAVGSFQPKEQNADIRRRHDAGEIDWVIQVDMWTRSRDPSPGRVTAIVDMRAGTSLLEKEQLPGRMNRNDPSEIVVFVEFIDAYHRDAGAKSRRVASIFDVLEQDTFGTDGSVIVSRRQPGQNRGARRSVPAPIDVNILPESLRAGAMALAGKVLSEVLVVGKLYAPLPKGSRRISELPIAKLYSDTTVRQRVLAQGHQILLGPGGVFYLSPEDFSEASLIEPETMSDGVLLPTKEALAVAGVGIHIFKKYVGALSVVGVPLRTVSRTNSVASHYRLGDVLAIRLAALTQLKPFDAEADEKLADIARELGWHLSRLHLMIHRMHDGAPIYECSIPGSRPASCVGKDFGRTIRREIGFRITDEMVSLDSVANDLQLTPYAVVKLLGNFGLQEIIKLGRYAAAGQPIEQQSMISIIQDPDYNRLQERIASEPNAPMLTIRDFIGASSLDASDRYPVQAFLTNFSAAAVQKTGLQSSLAVPMRQYVADNQQVLGQSVANTLTELFTPNRPHAAAQWILRQIAESPAKVGPLYRQPYDADLVAYLEDVLIRHVAKLVSPLLDQGARQ